MLAELYSLSATFCTITHLTPTISWDKLIARAQAEKEARWEQQRFCEIKHQPVMTGTIDGFKIAAHQVKFGVDPTTLPQERRTYEWEVRWMSRGWVFQLFGGPTGYEGWYVKHMVDCGLYDENSEPYVCACAGTPGRWAACYIDRAQLIKICRQVEQLTVFVD